MDAYDIRFENSGSCDVSVVACVVLPADVTGWDEDVECEVDLYVTSPERTGHGVDEDFDVQDVRVEEFGRVYTFDADDLDEVLGDEAGSFMDELRSSYDDYVDEECAASYM